MIDKIKEIQQLENTKYQPDRDGERLKALYTFLLENCSEKENFAEKSADMLMQLEQGILSEEEEKAWLDYASSMFSSFLAVHILSEQNAILSQDAQQAAAYFRTGNFYKEVSAVGLYACAQLLKSEEPMACYLLTKEAFEKDPNLGYTLGTEYRYDGDSGEENLTKACPICGSREVSPYYCSPQSAKGKPAAGFPPGKLWMKCSECDNYYTYDFPLRRVGEINGHYTKNQENQVLQARIPLHIYNDIFSKLRGLTKGKAYLEIGIGNGEMLAVAQEFGYQAEAVEICREDCERVSAALDIEIARCDIVEYETEKQYDVIVMGDVFEHVTDPMKVMRKVSTMLKEDGVLWLSTPNYNCAYARMEKFEHCMWHELNHYTYVSYESMKKLLERLKLEVVQYEMSKRYIGSMELFIQRKK